MVLKAGPDFRVAALGYAQDVLGGVLGLVTTFLDFNELFGLGVAYGALCGGIGAFVYVSAH
jgi:predicted exporter